MWRLVAQGHNTTMQAMSYKDNEQAIYSFRKRLRICLGGGVEEDRCPKVASRAWDLGVLGKVAQPTRAGLP
jgi:hypothetical protein